MPGRSITNRQYETYMTERIDNHLSRSMAAMKAGFSLCTAKRIDRDPRSPVTKKRGRRHGGGREDPFKDVWSGFIESILVAKPKLRPCGILRELKTGYSDKDFTDLRRTMDRKVRRWKAPDGPEKDVMFLQEKIPGRLVLSDFADASRLGIMIAGEPLKDRLYHFRMQYSGWEHVEIVQGGESFTSLSCGLQNAHFALGSILRKHRTDSLSAAFGNRKRMARVDLNRRYGEICAHFGMEPTRNNRSVAHENGSVESSHRHYLVAVEQVLILWGNRDFDNADDYLLIHAELTHNRRPQGIPTLFRGCG